MTIRVTVKNEQGPESAAVVSVANVDRYVDHDNGDKVERKKVKDQKLLKGGESCEMWLTDTRSLVVEEVSNG